MARQPKNYYHHRNKKPAVSDQSTQPKNTAVAQIDGIIHSKSSRSSSTRGTKVVDIGSGLQQMKNVVVKTTNIPGTIQRSFVISKENIDAAFAAPAKVSASDVLDRLTKSFQLTQIDLASQVLHCSPRALSLWKAGKAPNEAMALQLHQLDRLNSALLQLMPAEEIAPWFKRTNDYLDPLTPLEVLNRGQIDRLWHIIHNVATGMPT